MNFLIALRVALRSLMRNKVRSFLTMLGIIIGIAAVITVVAVGEGATVMIKDQIQTMGNNLVMVFPGSASKGHFHFGMGSSATLTAQDADAILKESTYVKAVTPIIRSGAQIVYKDKNWSTSVWGTSPSYTEIRSWDLEEGNFFIDTDIRSATRVCVIGKTLSKELFENDEPIGQVIRVKNMPFKVIGVLKKKGSGTWGQDQDDILLMPWTTVRRVIQNSTFSDVNQLMISLNSMKTFDEAKKEITAILRERHHLSPNAEDDFSITDMAEITQMITSTTQIMTLLLAMIASISLIVGGIGIMNIMLVSVTERTKEIGLRMAVGAKERDILLQFLVEAIVLSGIGGVLGIILGSTAAQIISTVSSWSVVISIGAVAIAFAFSAVVGVFFGFYPAWRASRLNPIEALRYE
jgi:putative ABC transport system permease protein